MYNVGELVLYNTTGICRVESIAPQVGSKSEVLYYTLVPLFTTGTVYVPVTTSVFMRPVISRSEAEALIRRLSEIPLLEGLSRDPRFLAEQYKAVINLHTCDGLVRLCKTIHTKFKNLTLTNKKPGKVDQQYLKLAEKLLYGELSVALGIRYEDVTDYINNSLLKASEV